MHTYPIWRNFNVGPVHRSLCRVDEDDVNHGYDEDNHEYDDDDDNDEDYNDDDCDDEDDHLFVSRIIYSLLNRANHVKVEAHMAL